MNGPWLRAVDIARYQKVGSGGLIKNADTGVTLADIRDFDVVLIKATQGVNIKDPQFDNSYAMARKFGKKVVAYHFNDNRMSIAAQVAFLLSVAPSADAYAIDQEGDFAFNDAQTQEFVTRVRGFGKRCGHYHSASGFGGVDADFKWVADYRIESLQDGFTPVAGYDVWQFSSEGGPDGAGLDLDWLPPGSRLAAILGLEFMTQAEVAEHYITKAAAAASETTLNAKVLSLQMALDAQIAVNDQQDDHIVIQDGTISELNDTVRTANLLLDEIEENRLAARRLLGIT